MDTFRAIEERRSVKHYDPNHRMSEGDFTKIMEAAILAPTSFNMQNWRFVRVTDTAIREKVRAAGWGQAQFSEASELLFICGDLKAYAKSPERYWANAHKDISDMMVPMIGQFYDNNESLNRDEVMRSGGMAAQNIMLAAKSLGYDTCAMIGFDAVAVADLIQLPADHVIVMALVIGKALKPANPRGGQLPLNEVIVKNTF